MSGDVQPRRRKDKKRKRDDRKSEGDVNLSRQPSLQVDDESSHGVQSSHMGSDDVHIHMQQESHTGGHWCAKALFFVLMAVLMALVGMIISETRGLTDVDTPLSKSRYSGYLEGWVEEHRREHDDHDEVAASIEEHEEHDELFDEEEDHSEVEEENHAEDSHEGDDVDNEAAVNDEDENVEDDEIEAISEEVLESDDEEVNLELDDDGDNNEDNDNTGNNDEDDVDDNEEDDDVDDMVNDEAVRESVENMNIAMEDDNANDDDENDDDADNDNDDGRTSSENRKQPSTNHNSKEDDDFLDSFDEDDDATDTVFLDNDAEELLHLRSKEQRLAEENAKEASNGEDADEKLDKEADVVTSYLNTQLNEKPNTKVDRGPLSQDEGDYGYLTRDRYRGAQDLNEDIAYENEMARADDQLLRQHHGRALVAYSEISHKFPDRSRPFLAQAKIYDYLGKKHRHVQFLANAIEAYKRYLAFDELIENDDEYREAAESCIHGMRSLGYLEAAVTIHRMLVNRFPNDPEQVNHLVLTLLMMDRYSEAKSWLSVSSRRWPQNGLAMVLLGYVLKMHDCEYHRAAEYLRRGIESRAKGTQEARFYIALGEVYERLGHFEHASATYKRGADLKLFPSLHQRSIYNQPNLRAQPVWRLEEKSTSYAYDLRAISAHWQIIRDEGLKLLDTNSNSDDDLVNGSDHFVPEAEGLLAAGNWQELLLFSRGERHERNCQRAPTTCFLIQQFRAAATCRRGQVKFSVMQPGTHVWSHCGPTNSRLRAHLGLVVPPRTRMRVVNETLNWIEGEFIIFDDSFEHEVWNEGEKLRLILIVDFWHPDLNEEQIQRLPKV